LNSDEYTLSEVTVWMLQIQDRSELPTTLQLLMGVGCLAAAQVSSKLLVEGAKLTRHINTYLNAGLTDEYGSSAAHRPFLYDSLMIATCSILTA
jgi:hypothetical protein